MLSDLLPILRVPYYRFNPNVPSLAMDETAPDKLELYQEIGRNYVQAENSRGKDDCEALGTLLTTGRGRSGVPVPRVSAGRLRSWPSALLLRIGHGIGNRVAGVRGRYLSRL